MKTNYFFFFTIVFTFFLQSCKKETSNSVSLNAVSKSLVNSTFKTLDLRPGPDNGQDAYVAWKADDAHYATVNFNYVPELPPLTWTDGGAVVKQRIYINFVGLSAIPKNAMVTSARLFLYGISSSLNHPEGNSTYPGSNYSGYGTNKCFVAQVTSPWDETTITWNKQPGYTTTNVVSFGPSTSQWNWDAEINVTDIVKNMVKYPNKNFGFGIAQQKEQIYRSLVFGSSEAVNVDDRPRLVVDYTL